MLYKNQNSYVIRIADNGCYIFYISQNHMLTADYYNQNSFQESFTVLSEIFEFSAAVDSSGQIHLIVLNCVGDILYLQYPNTKDSTLITNINLNYYAVKFLNIKIVNNQLHAFFISNNSNSKLWTINHNIKVNDKWIANKAAVVSWNQGTCPYIVASNNNNLYLFYSLSGCNPYTLKHFNSDFQVWTDVDHNIVFENPNNIGFIIDNTNTAYICFTSIISKNIYVLVRYKDLNITNSKWSQDISLSEHSINALHPSLCTNNNCIYVLWEEGGNIVYRKNILTGSDWSQKELLPFKKHQLFSSVYLSSFTDDPHFRGITTYMLESAPSFPALFVNSDFYKKLLENSIAVDNTASIDITNKNLTNNMSTDKDSEKLKECLHPDNEANNKIDADANAKMLPQLKAELSKKDGVIERLNILVNALYQDNNSKEYHIHQLEERLNRRFFHKLFRRCASILDNKTEM